MTTDLESIKKTLVGISQGNDILDTLIEFERTLDNAEIFAYKNWILGELVEGPTIERYWFKTVWMYPASAMPDPDAGLRLTKLGAKVSFRKGVFKRPVKVKGPEDWVDPETKKAKTLESEIWLVTIDLPMKYIERGLSQSEEIIQKDIQKTNDEIAGQYEEMSVEEPPMEGEMGMDDTGGEEGAAPEEEL